MFIFYFSELWFENCYFKGFLRISHSCQNGWRLKWGLPKIFAAPLFCFLARGEIRLKSPPFWPLSQLETSPRQKKKYSTGFLFPPFCVGKGGPNPKRTGKKVLCPYLRPKRKTLVSQLVHCVDWLFSPQKRSEETKTSLFKLPSLAS